MKQTRSSHNFFPALGSFNFSVYFRIPFLLYVSEREEKTIYFFLIILSSLFILFFSHSELFLHLNFSLYDRLIPSICMRY